ncbi:MAG: glycosyl hydrolase, partial [Actinobacteria bacterium]|nr:glycosyl hydrolase [Actinomycetota bacterium]
RMHPLMPDRLYQQNHCGIYRLDRPGERWERIGDNMPREVGDIGFPVELHPRDPDTAWVFPMDGTDVWPRTSPDGRPAVYVTRDAGASWTRLDSGLPRRGWFTVKRQAMTTDDRDPVGVYFGTTSGEIWGSSDEGATWSRIAEHLPEIYSVEVG